MKALVSGSAGYLGEAIVKALRSQDVDVVSVDIKRSPLTTHVGSILDRRFIGRCAKGVRTVFHAAALHKHHLDDFSASEFLRVNAQGTLTLLESAIESGAGSFVYTSTTSVYGLALKPRQPGVAIGIDESVPLIPKNIYGVSKKAAEDICELFANALGLRTTVLRVARFYREPDINRDGAVSDLNHKVNDLIYRRVAMADAVDAHLAAARRERGRPFEVFVIAPTSPILRSDLSRARSDLSGVLSERLPSFQQTYQRLGWTVPNGIDRVYFGDAARSALDWHPAFTFCKVLEHLESGHSAQRELVQALIPERSSASTEAFEVP